MRHSSCPGGRSPPSIPRRNPPSGIARPKFAGRIVANEQAPPRRSLADVVKEGCKVEPALADPAARFDREPRGEHGRERSVPAGSTACRHRRSPSVSRPAHSVLHIVSSTLPSVTTANLPRWQIFNSRFHRYPPRTCAEWLIQNWILQFSRYARRAASCGPGTLLCAPKDPENDGGAHKKKGRLRCHKRPKSREETPKEGSDSGVGLGGRYRISRPLPH